MDFRKGREFQGRTSYVCSPLGPPLDDGPYVISPEALGENASSTGPTFGGEKETNKAE